MNIVLASESPRRKQIMDKTGWEYIVDPANIDEKKFKHASAKKLAEKLALAKAENVAKRHKDAIIIGSDLVVAYKNHQIGKPTDESDAKKILKLLKARTHQVITSVAVINTSNNKKASGTSIASVKMKDYSDQEIDDYIATGEPMDKGGAYAIQGNGKKLIENFSGDIEGIIGLPTKILFGLMDKIK